MPLKGIVVDFTNFHLFRENCEVLCDPYPCMHLYQMLIRLRCVLNTQHLRLVP